MSLSFLVLGTQRGEVAHPMDAEAVLRLSSQPPQGATLTTVPKALPGPGRDLASRADGLSTRRGGSHA